MREKLMLFALFGILALMQSDGNCEELPRPTSKGQSFRTNTTTYSTALSSYDTHSISKRETKDHVINALNGVGILFTAGAVLSAGFPPAALALGLFASVAQLGSFLVTLVTSNSEKIPGRTLSRTQLLKRIKDEAGDYDLDLEGNFRIIKNAIANLHQDFEVFSKNQLFYSKYNTLKLAFAEYLRRPKGPNVKKDLEEAASRNNIREILNGIGTHMLDQNFFNAKLAEADYSGEAFAAWTGAARTYLYETIVIRALTFGVLSMPNKYQITNATVKAELLPFMDTANSILDRMFKLGRKLYWENDIEENMRKEMNNWYEDGFQGSFGRAMSKYVNYTEQHIVVGVSSSDLNAAPSCTGNGKHDYLNRMPNATENMKIVKLRFSQARNRFANYHRCMTIYIIRFPLPTQNVTGKRTLPTYVKFVGQNYGDAVTQLDTSDRNYKSKANNDPAVFGGVLVKSGEQARWNQQQCYFDLARFRFDSSPYNNLIVWPLLNIPYGLIMEKNYVPYTYKNEVCHVDTFALC